MNMIKLLWIPAFAPYNNVKHAGGKNVLLYTTMLAQETDIDFTLLTMCHADEISRVNESYGNTKVHLRIIEQWDAGIKKFLRMLMNFESAINPYNRNARFLDNWTELYFIREIDRMKSEGYIPDIIVLQYTQVVFLAKKIKHVYPDCKIIAIEEDVAYLGYERRIAMAKGRLKISLAKISAKRLKKKEVDLLNMVDLIVTNNYKDKRLLEKENIGTKIIMVSPYYQSFINVPRKYNGSKDILFYGAMNREENWKSVIWFAEKVLPQLKDTGVKLKVIGGNPNPTLLKFQSPQLEILGYVEDITVLFSTSLCLVAPLVLGAGIKIKILEGLSAGIPILTNTIGIEGIPATNNIHYYHCEMPDEYVITIKGLLEGRENMQDIEKNAKELINTTFNYNETNKTFINEIRLLKS